MTLLAPSPLTLPTAGESAVPLGPKPGASSGAAARRSGRGRWTLAAALLASLGAHASALALLLHFAWTAPPRAEPETFDVGIAWGAGGRAGSLPAELVSALPPAAGAPALQQPRPPAAPVALQDEIGTELAAADRPQVAVDAWPAELPAAMLLGLGRGTRDGAARDGARGGARAPGDGEGDGLALHAGTNAASGSPWGTLQGGTEGAGGSGIAGRGASGAGGGVTPPLPLADNAPPVYPESARRRGAAGLVLIEVVVDHGGAALSVAVVRSSGDAELDQAALDAVAEWRFAATVSAGEPAERRITVPIEFRLHRPES